MAQCIHLILRRHLVDVKPRRPAETSANKRLPRYSQDKAEMVRDINMPRRPAEPSAHKRLPRCVRDIAEIVRDIKTAPSCAAIKAVIKAVMRRHYVGTFIRATSFTSKS